MLRKTLLATLSTVAIAVGVITSSTGSSSADVGLFFNYGQQYYGQNYYGLYPFAPTYYYDPYYYPFYSYDPNSSTPYSYRTYHYRPPHAVGYSYKCARFHTYNPATHTYVGKDGLSHHCP